MDYEEWIIEGRTFDDDENDKEQALSSQSVGQAISERQRLETSYQGQIDRTIRNFMLAVIALAVLYKMVPNVFSLWSRAVDDLEEEGAPATVILALRSSSLPGAVIEATQAALDSAKIQALADVDYEAYLRNRLGFDPENPGKMQTGPETSRNWQADADNLAMTQATADFSDQTLAALAEEGWAQKQWITRADLKVREAHAEVHGQTVPLAQEFIVGGEALRYPSDPDGSWGNTMNCRCIIIGSD